MKILTPPDPLRTTITPPSLTSQAWHGCRILQPGTQIPLGTWLHSFQPPFSPSSLFGLIPFPQFNKQADQIISAWPDDLAFIPSSRPLPSSDALAAPEPGNIPGNSCGLGRRALETGAVGRWRGDQDPKGKKRDCR